MALQVSFAKEFIKDNGMFDDMLDYVHIDKKWFFLIVNGNHYYLTLKEELPFKFVQHKKHIIKVVCLAAVAYPFFDTKCCRMKESKIGIWPSAHQIPAKKNSKNRPKGTLEWKGYPATTKNGAGNVVV